MCTNITIFSTKTLKEDNCLFDNSVKQISNSTAQEIVYDYFLRIRELIYSDIINDKNKTDLFKKLFTDKLNSIESGFDEYATENDKTEAKRAKQNITKEFLKRRIDRDFLPGHYDIDNIMERINKWGLEGQVLDMCTDGESIKKVEEKSRIYQIAGTNVYALHCLENDDKDTSGKRWIPCLIKCAKALAVGASSIDINLVLHDKDLGNNSTYAAQDVTILDNDEVRDIFDKTQTLLQKNDHCRIIFFQHTSNAITQILREPFSKSRDIHYEVKKAFTNYQELNEIKEKSAACLRYENGIIAAKKLNDNLNAIIDQL